MSKNLRDDRRTVVRDALSRIKKPAQRAAIPVAHSASCGWESLLELKLAKRAI
jgi:S-ribosylhomocysteine lyase LuxS involved in autoinducer biosynthesis